MIDLVLEHPAPRGNQRKFWLRSGDKVRVGATEWADYIVKDDMDLSPVHFQVEHLGNYAQVRDLGSASGTYRNGHRLPLFSLSDGDVIQAGQTQFRAIVRDRLTRQAFTDRGAAPDHRLDYQIESMPNGLLNFASNVAHGHHEVLNGIFGQLRLTAIINREAVQARDLISSEVWKSKAIPLSESMMMLPIGDAATLEMSGTLWGADVCTIIASSGNNQPSQTRPRSIASVFYSTASVRTQLIQGSPAYVKLLTEGMAAILLEKNQGIGWHLFAKSNSDQPWHELGCPPPKSSLRHGQSN